MSARGYGLVEILVALALGALAIVAGVTAYGEGRALHARASELGRLNERAQYAISVLEPDLQMAGYYGFATDPSTMRFAAADAHEFPAQQLRATSTAAAGLPRSAQACGNNFAVDVMTPLQVSDPVYAPTCAASGGGAVPGADAFTLRRATVAPAEAAAGHLQILASRLSPDNQVVFVGDRVPGERQLVPGRSELRDLIVHSYYVAQRADGASAASPFPALRIKSLSAIAASPAFIDTEVVSGVEDMQLQIGYVPAAAAAAPRFTDAVTLPAHTRIVAARVWLRLRTEAPDPGFVDSRSYDYAGVHFVPQDHFHRLLVVHTVALRNPFPAEPARKAGA